MHFRRTCPVKQKTERCTTIPILHVSNSASLAKIWAISRFSLSLSLDLADGNQDIRADILENNVCEKITEVTETERTRREYEDSIKRRHHRLMKFVDTHVKDDQIQKYIRVRGN